MRDESQRGSTAPPAVLFRYTPDRKGEHPRAHLTNFAGTLHADGYAGLDQLFEMDPSSKEARIREAACSAHVRRKFYDIHKATPSPIAWEVLKRIGALYEVESDIRGKTR